MSNSLGYVHPVGNDVWDIYIDGQNSNRPVLRIDAQKAVVVNLIDGVELSFINAFDGYKNRRVEWVPSESDLETEYMVTKVDMNDPRSWTCSCPDFRHRRSGWTMTCKHVGFIVTGEYQRLRL